MVSSIYSTSIRFNIEIKFYGYNSSCTSFTFFYIFMFIAIIKVVKRTYVYHKKLDSDIEYTLAR